MSHRSHLSPALQARALRVMYCYEVTYASQLGDLLMQEGVIQDRRGGNHHRQGLGLIGGSIAHRLYRAGLCTNGGQGERYKVTQPGMAFIRENHP